MSTATQARFMHFFHPGRWLPLEQIRTAAKTEGRVLTERWDVPSVNQIPEDLRDSDPRYFRLATGSRISGRMLPEDLQIGFQSAAVPLLLAMVPLLTLVTVPMLAAFGPILGSLPILALAAIVAMVATFAGTGMAVLAAIIGIVLPLFGTQGGQSFGYALFGMDSLAALPLRVGLPALALAAIVINNRKLRLAAMAASGAFALSLVVALLPRSLHPVFWLALSCALTPGYAYWVWRTWALRLAAQGIAATLESTGPQAGGHIAARQIQAKNASEDSSALIQIGTAKGVFTKKQDGYAPDAGLPFCLSAGKDLSTHFVCYGATGSGKTSAVLRPLAVAIIRAGCGGLLILDGKGSLASEFAGLRDYMLITPKTCELGLLEGLDPIDLVIAFESIARAGVKSESGSSAFFNTQARDMLHHGAVFLRAICDSENRKHGANSTDRLWRWTLHDLYSLLVRAQRGNKTTATSMDGAIAQVRAMCAEVGQESLLDDTIEYLETLLPAMDAEARANVWATLQNWILPATRHPDLIKWARCEHGVNVEEVLRGRVAGVCLPDFTYGVAGKLIQALIKQRVFVGIRRRADRDWRAEGEKDVVMLCDEAQELVGEADLKMLPVARSLGCQCVYATQQVENFIARFGDANASDAFTGNFLSFVSFRSSPATMKWAQQRLGTTWSLIFQSKTFGVDYRGAWRMIAESPLADPHHPAHRYYRQLLQRGAGVMRESRHGPHGLLAHGSGKGIDEDQSLTLPAMRGGQWVQQPLFQDAEADFLAEPFVAVAEVMRGNVRRRDIIQCTPMFKVPADLLVDPVNASELSEDA